MMKVYAKSIRRQRGAALVETVVMSPLLLFLLVLTAEVTNAFVDHNTLSKATRAGVRHLASNAVLGTTGTVTLTPDLTSEARNLVVFGNVAGAGVPVLPGLAAANVEVLDLGNNNVQLTATYAYSGILGGTLPNFGFGADGSLLLDMKASVSMRAL